MQGIALISYINGWSCSNEAVLDADKHITVIEGKKYSKSVLTLKIISIFDVKSKTVENQDVECLFKTEEGKKLAFKGKIKSIGKKTTVIHELLKADIYETVLNNIKNEH